MTDKNYHIIFQHGWGLSPELWKIWEDFLPISSKITYLSRGYFSEPSFETNFDRDTHNIFICHSLGIHLAPINILNNTNLLVIFGGFKYFHGDEGFKSRLSQKIVDVMLKEIKKKPKAVIEKFCSRCDIHDNLTSNYLNNELLINDLKFLDKNELDLKIFDNIPRILLFHGKKDKIVPLERSEMLHKNLKQSELIVYNDAGHGLPFTHSKACVEDITEKGLGISI